MQVARDVQLPNRYIVVVSSAGFGLLGALAASQDFSQVVGIARQFWMLTVFVLLGELFPLRVLRSEKEEEISISTTFSFALVLMAGAGAAVIVQAVASLAGALLRRKSAWGAAFNVAQYTLAITATAGSLTFLSSLRQFRGGTTFTAAELPAMLVAAIVFFLVNRVLTGVALALSRGIPVGTYLLSDFAFQASTRGALLALAPVVVVVSATSVWLIPLIALPIAAVFRTATVENLRLVEKLAGSLSQLTELNRLNEHQALHDFLTDLPNRTLFADRLRQAVLHAQREHEEVAVMIIDLDRFKEINDTLGHHHGDALLKQLGPRIEAVIRESDTVARLGGDEFGVLLPDSGPAAALHVARKIQTALARPFHVNEMTLEVEGSIGISLYPAHGDEAEGLIRQADVAMYSAKENKTRVQVYAPEDDPYSPGRLALVGELRRALQDGDQLQLHFQPKIALQDGGVGGVEVLLRWRHPRHGLLTPDRFIPLAEQTGLIKELSLYVLDRALSQCREWRDAGLGLSVAVNLAAWSFIDLRLPQEVAELLHKWDVPPSQLKLEITESTLMSDRQAGADVLASLSAMGVGISIDDFGTGYSSLAYLKQLPIEEIKIDKSFVMNMVLDDNDAKIVRSTIDLGRNLGLRVVAEGVETREICERLWELGCEEAQGFYFARPVPGSEVVETTTKATARWTPPLRREEGRSAAAGSGASGEQIGKVIPLPPKG